MTCEGNIYPGLEGLCAAILTASRLSEGNWRRNNAEPDELKTALGPKSPLSVYPDEISSQFDQPNDHAYFFTAAFCFAQRLRCASAILFLPAADMVLFLGAAADSDVRGRPLRLPEAVPTRRERADCRRAISASMAERISRAFIQLRYQKSGLAASYVFASISSVLVQL